jgi:hypothetical protein
MSSLEELKDALRDTLAARGSLGQIQARVRAEIFNALEETVAACSVCSVVFSLPKSSSLYSVAHVVERCGAQRRDTHAPAPEPTPAHTRKDPPHARKHARTHIHTNTHTRPCTRPPRGSVHRGSLLTRALLQDDPKPPLSHENLVLNELIRDYLEYNHYKARTP